MTNKTRIEMSLALPSVPDAQDACVKRLTELLQAKDGITVAHLPDAGSHLCIHYDPERISAVDVRELATRAGAELDQRYGHFLVRVGPMHAREARTYEGRAQSIKGVLEAAVSPAGVVRIEFDRQASDEFAIKSELQRIGLRATEGKPLAEKPAEKDHEHGGWFGERAELVFALASGAFLLVGWLLSFTSVTSWVPWIAYLAAYLFGGFFTLREGFENIRARRFEIDCLMVVAAIGAASLGKFFEGALLLFLFSLGHALEHYAMGRAKRAIEALSELAPQIAFVRRDGETIETPIEELRIGDVVIVKPNERIPADGIVVKGTSSVNQAPITGESVPVDKEAVAEIEAAANADRIPAKHRTFAGTINGSGALEIQVTKLASDSTLARVVKMVSEAETQKSPTQRFTDRFERIFVPAALTLAISLLFAWIVIDEPFSASFYRAMAVLVAASPCALAIATPSAVLSAVAHAARGGVLVKGGGPLENLGRLGVIAFDKTGTLTEGKPKLTDVNAAAGVSEEELLDVAVAVERLSDHPLAAAVVRGAEDRLKRKSDLQAHDVQSITGRGVKASVEGQPVYIAKDQLFAEIEGPPIPDALRGAIDKFKASGRTTMVLRRGDTYLGVLGLMDVPREAAKGVIVRLRELGIQRMVMLSGDSQQVADAIANEIGLSEAIGDLMPDDKVREIKRLGERDSVAMVGDGVNDAPAMASAAVGIAMGAAGSDVALETADIALMADDLNHLPFAVGLSRQTSRIIRQNLWFSLGMVAFLVPATMLGLQMGAAVAFHEGSTLLVVVNALRLLAFRSE